MAIFNVPADILDNSLQRALLGFTQPAVAGFQRGQQRTATQELAQQFGINLPFNTPPQTAQLLLANALQQQQQQTQPFTLGPGQQRFGAGGQPIAAGPAVPISPTQQIAQQKLNRIKQLQAIPENRRTNTQKESLKRLIEGQSAVQVNVGNKQLVTNSLALGRSFRADERIKDMRTIEKFTQNMVTAFDRSLKQTKNFGPIDIALAKSFQKLTDLGSTVREGEFATTFEGQRLINRVRGKVDALLKGGLGFTPEDRKELVNLALALMEDSKTLFNQAITEFTVTSDELGLKTRAVLGGIKPFGITPSQQPQQFTPDQVEAELRRRGVQ